MSPCHVKLSHFNLGLSHFYVIIFILECKTITLFCGSFMFLHDKFSRYNEKLSQFWNAWHCIQTRSSKEIKDNVPVAVGDAWIDHLACLVSFTFASLYLYCIAQDLRYPQDVRVQVCKRIPLLSRWDMETNISLCTALCSGSRKCCNSVFKDWFHVMFAVKAVNWIAVRLIKHHTCQKM